MQVIQIKQKKLNFFAIFSNSDGKQETKMAVTQTGSLQIIFILTLHDRSNSCELFCSHTKKFLSLDPRWNVKTQANFNM